MTPMEQSPGSSTWDTLLPEDMSLVQSWATFLCSLPDGPPPYMADGIDLLQRAAAGQPIDTSDSEWKTAPRESQRGAKLTGSINSQSARWRWLGAKPELHRDILRNGWADPKIDPGFDYSAGQDTKPCGPVTDKQRLMATEIDKLHELGVVSDWDPSTDYMPGHPTHILKHAMLPKLDDDGYPSGEWRMTVLGKYVSSNEDVPHFQGPSDNDFAMFLEANAWLMKADAKKFFHQFRARQRQTQLMLFWHPVRRVLQCYRALVMGIKGGSRVAQLTTSELSNILRTRLQMKIHPYCDEIASQQRTRLLAYLQQMVIVLVMVWLCIIVNWEKTLCSSPKQTMLFLGMTASTNPLRVAPSPGRLRVMRELAQDMLLRFKQNQPVRGAWLRRLLGIARSMLRLHHVIGCKTLKLTVVARQHALQYGSTRADFNRPIERSRLQWVKSEIAYLAASNPSDEWRFASQTGMVSTHRFVSDASQWGAAAEPCSPSLAGIEYHSYYTPEVQEEHHNFQEMMGPLHYTDVAYEMGAVQSGQMNRPEVWMMLLDNITVVSLINKLRTRSMPMAKAFVHFSRFWHHRAWTFHAMHIDKLTMDTKYTVDQKGRSHSTRNERGLPPALLMEVMAFLWSSWPAVTPVELTRMSWVDMFTSHTIRQSDLYVTLDREVRTPKPLWMDAFHPLQPWNQETNQLLQPDWGLYLFPPEKLTAKVVDRVQADGCKLALLVTPYTSKCPILRIQQAQRSPMVFFAVHQDQLTPPEGFPNAPKLDGQQLRTFVATILSASCSEPEVIQPTPSRMSSWDDTRAQKPRAWPSIVLPGHDGAISSLAKANIRFASQLRQ